MGCDEQQCTYVNLRTTCFVVQYYPEKEDRRVANKLYILGVRVACYTPIIHHLLYARYTIFPMFTIMTQSLLVNSVKPIAVSCKLSGTM